MLQSLSPDFIDSTLLDRHYQDAYAMLIVMFGSTAILPPRTKRWAEAKVLADCINMKVGYVYRYKYSPSSSLFRCPNCTFTIMNTPSLFRITILISENLLISPEGGVLGKKHLNFGVGWHDSVFLHSIPVVSIPHTYVFQTPSHSGTPRTRNPFNAKNSQPSPCPYAFGD